MCKGMYFFMLKNEITNTKLFGYKSYVYVIRCTTTLRNTVFVKLADWVWQQKKEKRKNSIKNDNSIFFFFGARSILQSLKFPIQDVRYLFQT